MQFKRGGYKDDIRKTMKRGKASVRLHRGNAGRGARSSAERGEGGGSALSVGQR